MAGELLDALLVALGGALGAVARHYVSGIVQRLSGATLFPLGTLAVNALGSLLLGFVMGGFKWGVFTREQRLLLATGFAGGFTTFSTFSYESLTLLAEAPLLGLVNIAASIIAGLASVYLGYVAAGVLYAPGRR